MPVLSPKFLSFLSALPLVTTCFVSPARADSYKLYVVANTQSEHFVMGDDFGDYAFNSSFSSITGGHTNLCGTSYLDPCYQVGNVFTGKSYFSNTIPDPVTDPKPLPGHAEIPTGPEWTLTKDLGNLFVGYYQSPSGQTKRGIWDGSDPVASFLGYGSIDGGFASSNGDVFYIDGINDSLVVGIDQQTSPVPEPGTLPLTATALLAISTLRRRVFHN